MIRSLWLVRHGPTHQKSFTGWRDVPADLSDKAAIARLAEFLPKAASIVSSDLMRAVATADAIAGDRYRHSHHEDLREIDFGEWDGLTFAEVEKRDPVLSRTYWEQPGDIAPPSGESWNAVAARCDAALDMLLRTTEPNDVIAVAHMGVIMTQIARAQGKGAYAAMGHHIDPLSITQIIVSGPRWELGPVNLKP